VLFHPKKYLLTSLVVKFHLSNELNAPLLLRSPNSFCYHFVDIFCKASNFRHQLHTDRTYQIKVYIELCYLFLIVKDSWSFSYFQDWTLTWSFESSPF
jgi:hypothetical protein